jgi:hypothetical protein
MLCALTLIFHIRAILYRKTLLSVSSRKNLFENMVRWLTKDIFEIFVISFLLLILIRSPLKHTFKNWNPCLQRIYRQLRRYDFVNLSDYQFYLQFMIEGVWYRILVTLPSPNEKVIRECLHTPSTADR